MSGERRHKGWKSERSVGPTLNALTRVACAHGVDDRGKVRWPFEYGRPRGDNAVYDMPEWVRGVVLYVLGDV